MMAVVGEERNVMLIRKLDLPKMSLVPLIACFRTSVSVAELTIF
jgi:hypothetical protein